MNIATVQDVQMVETGNGGAPDSSHASQRRADLLMQSKRWRTLLSLTMLMAGCLTACNAETPAGASIATAQSMAWASHSREGS